VVVVACDIVGNQKVW